jgi:hypothetical protein
MDWLRRGAESMGPSLTFLVRLRASPMARIPAVWLVLFQVIFTAEHLSAMAAAASGRSGSGILDICHVALDEAGQPGPVQQPNGALDPQSCLLCSAVSAAGAAVAPAPPALAHALAVAEAPPGWTAVEAHFSPPRLHYGAIRGPPPILIS